MAPFSETTEFIYFFPHLWLFIITNIPAEAFGGILRDPYKDFSWSADLCGCVFFSSSEKEKKKLSDEVEERKAILHPSLKSNTDTLFSSSSSSYF